MPAADITEVKVTYHDERRGAAEYSPPMKKAEVSLFAAVPAGGDGVAALNYVTKLAQDKVREILAGPGQAAPAPVEEPIPPTSSASQASQPEEAATGETQRRTRRTKAQIEADNAAAAAAAGSTTSASATDASAGSQEETPGQPASEQPSTAGSATDDEWAAAAPETVTITDQELNHTCSVTAERTKDPSKVKETIGKFSPGGDAWDPAKPGGRRFTVNDIPANQRADFIAQLKAL